MLDKMDNIVMFKPYINEKAAIPLVAAVLKSGWIGEGPKVKTFENRLRARLNLRYCVALNSGTAALRLALAMCGVGPGDEVITPAYTCTATNMPILGLFARPVFADIRYETGNIDPEDIAHRITKHTKAIMVVHWAGYPADLDAIHKIAWKHSLWVIEDAAHALGAKYHGEYIGAISPFTMFSFQAIKQLTTGDGGLLAMGTKQHYDEARRRRWFGIDRVNRVKQLNGYSHWDQAEVGYKMHMNDISAAIGLANMEDLSWILDHRRRMARLYDRCFAGLPGVTLFENQQGRDSAHWLYTMHVERRDDFCGMMQSKGIEVSVVHIRNDVHSVFGPRRRDLPQTDRYEGSNISIPLHNHLADEDVHRVIEAVKGGW